MVVLRLGVPFLVAVTGFSWFLTGLEALRRCARWALGSLRRVAGILLVVISVHLGVGEFVAVSSSLVDLAYWTDLEL